MKKKLLIMLAVVSMLVCIFAISVSAKTITTVDGKEVTVTTYDDAPAKTNIVVSTDDVVVFDDGFCCPSAYVFKDSKTKMWDGNGNGAINDALDFSFVNGKREKTYTLANITEFDVPEGVTHIGGRMFQGITTIKRVTIPKTAKTFGNALFQGSTGLLECEFEHTADSEATKFPSYTFFGCTNLKAFSMPDCFTEIYDVATFSKCTNMTAVHLSEKLVKWTSGGGGSRTATFDDCYNMYFVNETFTCDDIPEKPEVYYFPANLANSDAKGDFTKQSTMRDCHNLNNVLVFGTGITSFTNEYLFQGGVKNTVVFLGDMQTLKTGNYWGTTTFYFANPADKSVDDLEYSLVPNYSGAKTLIFCNADGNTNHLYLVESNTAPTCTNDGVKGFKCFCGKASDTAETIPALGHEKNELLSKYFASVNGTLDYYNDMVTEHSCTRCDATIVGTEENTALFDKKGYSYSETDSSFFSYTVYVNHNAIEKYNASLLYGIVVSANPSGAPISYVDGAISHDNKTIAMEFQSTDVNYSIITAKLTNVAKNTELHLGAYCVDNNKVSYLGHDTVSTVCETISHAILTEKYPNGKE